VTQVAHAAEGHGFHTRLAHTLKVAQVGRRLAEHLVKVSDPALVAAAGLDPDVVETACLAHDIGHPPFGHVAEKSLNRLVEQEGVQDGFEGNPQSFRILTRVAIRKEAYLGLNLTRATLNAVLKYPWRRAVGDHWDKWGYYLDDVTDFTFAREGFGVSERKSLEAELMDWADDVTNAVHDTEDFYRVGLIPLDQLLAGTDERERFIEAAIKPESRDFARDLFQELNDLAVGAVEEIRRPFTGARSQRAALKYFASLLITRYAVNPDEPPIKINESTLPADRRVVVVDTIASEIKVLKRLLIHYVLDNPALAAQEYGQRRVIERLFAAFFGAVQKNSRERSIVPTRFRETAEQIDNENLATAEDKRKRARLVSDIISSLTENEALLLDSRLSGVALGSVLDPIVP
jgi:dGTPase